MLSDKAVVKTLGLKEDTFIGGIRMILSSLYPSNVLRLQDCEKSLAIYRKKRGGPQLLEFPGIRCKTSRNINLLEKLKNLP